MNWKLKALLVVAAIYAFAAVFGLVGRIILAAIHWE